MPDHVILLAPSSNRVYAGNADRLSAAELAVMTGLPGTTGPSIRPVDIAGVRYLQLEIEELDERIRSAVSRLSAFFAVFLREGGHLVPVPADPPGLFDDDLVTIPKYPGKTNEQFTRLMLNVTLGSISREPPTPLSVLDPLCGRGTTLSCALMLGHDAAGVDQDVKVIESYATYLRTYLRRKRLKHTAEVSPVRREGQRVGRRLDLEVSPEGTDRRLRLTAFTGDTRQSAALFGKRRFDAVVTDAPYGIVHGSHTGGRGASGARDRSPAGLIGEALTVWASQLKTGGALGLSWNTFGLSRDNLSELAAEAGLRPLNDGPYLDFGHRVDAAISRDLFVAVKS